MMHDKMYLGRLMVHAQLVEEIRRRKRGREEKKPRPSDEAGSNTGRSSFGIQDRPKFIKGNEEMPSVIESRVVSVVVCMESGHMIRDCPQVKNQAKEDTQPRPNPTTTAEPLKRNRLYALKDREEQEKSAYVVTGNLLVFFLPVYALLDRSIHLVFCYSFSNL
ncbi:uncharacterized protein LOC107003800 [Solanum pennellii]|uniref:Uncharacterized protein LOC107003800 n=1 Tax=Solanum pennellii TaxID=28526 RepID=A0ABM1FJ07_SOLPN|nr:uncharacterized protein LOC107003800 [Solanum pennellii]